MEMKTGMDATTIFIWAVVIIVIFMAAIFAGLLAMAFKSQAKKANKDENGEYDEDEDYYEEDMADGEYEEVDEEFVDSDELYEEVAEPEEDEGEEEEELSKDDAQGASDLDQLIGELIEGRDV